MFTKYANVKLPENYGGSRFKRSTIETEMKTHRPQDMQSTASSVKTSVSPFFQSAHMHNGATASENIIEESTEDTEEEITYGEEIQEENEEIIHTPPKKSIEESKNSLHGSIAINELTRMLEKFKSDDILLLILILLFAKDGGEGSTDALVILALLLLYR